MLKFCRGVDLLDLETYTKHINGNNFVWMDYDGLKHQAVYEELKRETLGRLTREMMEADAPGRFYDMSRNSIYNYLVKVCGCPDIYFKRDTASGFSLEADKILLPLMEKGFAVPFLHDYITYSSSKAVSSRAVGLLNIMEGTGEYDRVGHQLGRLPFTVSQQQNLRFNYRDTDLISIPSVYKEKFTVPRGYCLAWGDFKQSDLRISFNLFLDGGPHSEIMRTVSDSYEAIVRILCKMSNIEFDLEEFQENRENYKTYILASIYGKKETLSEQAAVIVRRMKTYLDACPRYVEYKSRIATMELIGLPVQISGYFGHTEVVGINRGRSLLTKSLNTPVQTGTSEIVVLCVNKILERFYSLGYTSDDIRVYMIRHDELVFLLKEETLLDSWILKDSEEILIDNWSPLGLSFNYGYNYGVPDPDVQEAVEMSYKLNYERRELYYSTPPISDYYPVKKPLSLVASSEIVGDKTIVAIVDSDSLKTKFYCVDSTSEEYVAGTIIKNLVRSESLIIKAGYASVLLYSMMISRDVLGDFLLFKFKSGYNSRYSYSNVLAHWMAARYAKREGIPFNVNLDLLEANSRILNNVEEFDVL